MTKVIAAFDLEATALVRLRASANNVRALPLHFKSLCGGMHKKLKKKKTVCVRERKAKGKRKEVICAHDDDVCRKQELLSPCRVRKKMTSFTWFCADGSRKTRSIKAHYSNAVPATNVPVLQKPANGLDTTTTDFQGHEAHLFSEEMQRTGPSKVFLRNFFPS